MKSSHETRLLAGILLLIAFSCGLPMLLKAAAPDWWQVNQAYRYQSDGSTEALDYGAVNQGQLKNVAVSAYEHLVATLPSSLGTVGNHPDGSTSSAGQAILSLISIWVEIDPASGRVKRQVMDGNEPLEPIQFSPDGTGPRKRSNAAASHNDFRIVTQGQLKAVAKPFYRRLAEIYAPFGYPFAWTDDDNTGTSGDTVDDQNASAANIGQLKRVFSFDLLGDSDLDKVPDIVELARTRNGVKEPTNPYQRIDADGDGMADDWELAWNLNPAVVDTSNSPVGMGPTAIQMYEAGMLPDSTAPPDSVDWTPIRRVSLRQQQVSENGQELDLLTWDIPPSLSGNVTIEREIEDDVWVAVHTAAVQAGEASIPSFDRSNSQYIEKLPKGIVPSYSEAFNHRLKGVVTSNESIVQVRLKVCRVGTDVYQPGFAEFSSDPTKYYLKFTETYTGPDVSGNAHGTVNVAARTLTTGLTYVDEEDINHANATMTWPVPAKLEDPVEGASISETISGGGTYEWMNHAGDEKEDGTHDAIHTRTWQRRSPDNFEVYYEDWEMVSSAGSETINEWVYDNNDWIQSEIWNYEITSTNDGTWTHSKRPNWVPEVTHEWRWVCETPDWTGINFSDNAISTGTVNTDRNVRTATWNLAWSQVVSLSMEFTGAQLQAYAATLLPDFEDSPYARYQARRNTGSNFERDRFEPGWLSRETQFLPRTWGGWDLSNLNYEISRRNLRLGNGSIELTKGVYSLECNDCLPSDPVIVAEVEYRGGAPINRHLVRTLSLTPGSRPGKPIKSEVVISDVTNTPSNTSRFLTTVSLKTHRTDALGNIASSPEMPKISTDYPVIDLTDVQINNVRLDGNGKLCADVTVQGEVTSNLCDMMSGVNGQINALKLFINEMSSPVGVIPVSVTKGNNGTVGKPFSFKGLINHTLVGVPFAVGTNLLRIEGQDRVFELPGYSEWRAVIRSVDVPLDPNDPNGTNLLVSYGFSVVVGPGGEPSDLLFVRGNEPSIEIPLSELDPNDPDPDDEVIYEGSDGTRTFRLSGFEQNILGERGSLYLEVSEAGSDESVVIVLTESGIGTGSFGGSAKVLDPQFAGPGPDPEEETRVYNYLESIHLVHYSDDPRFCSFVYKFDGLPPGGNEVTIKLARLNRSSSGSLGEMDMQIREILVQGQQGYFITDPNATRPATFILRPPKKAARTGVGLEFEAVPHMIQNAPEFLQVTAGVFAGMGHGGVDLVTGTAQTINSALNFGVTTANGYGSWIMLQLPWTEHDYWGNQVDAIGQELDGVTNKAIQQLAERWLMTDESGLPDYIVGLLTGDKARREDGATRLGETLGPYAAILEDALVDAGDEHPFIRGKISGRIGFELAQILMGAKGVKLRLQQLIERMKTNPFLKRSVPKLQVLAAQIKGSPLKESEWLALVQFEIEKKFGPTVVGRQNALKKRAETYEETIAAIRKRGDGIENKVESDFEILKGAQNIVAEALADFAKGPNRTVQLADLKGYTWWDRLFKKHGIGRKAAGWEVHHLVERDIQKKLEINPPDDDCPSIPLPIKDNVSKLLGDPGTVFHKEPDVGLAIECRRIALEQEITGDNDQMLRDLRALYIRPENSHLNLWPATREWLRAKLPPGSYLPPP